MTYNFLNVNPEGIDVATNLLTRIEELQNEIMELRRRLRVLQEYDENEE